MKWMDPPQAIRRFTLNQIIQHWAAAGLGFVLAVSASLMAVSSGVTWGGIHLYAGLSAAGLLLVHLLSLVAIGIRQDIPSEKVAFLPFGSGPSEKYSPEEKGDYFNILAWSLLLVITGILLRWPGRLGIPGPGSYAWLRVVHAGCGAAWVLHLLVIHVGDRWFRSSEDVRRAIFTGMVPLEAVSMRAGWVGDLVRVGLLVPMPDEKPQEERKESLQVREILEEGNRLAREEKYGEAAKAFEGALSLYPEYAQARFNLAVARLRQGEMELAEEQLLRFLEMDPFNPMSGKARDLLQEIADRKEGGSR